MTWFDEQFAEVAIDPLMDTFGEYITYHPTHAGNTGPRAIRAMVTRQTPTGLIGDALTPNIVIEVENHHTRGIDSTTIDKGGDKVMVAEIENQAPRSMSIVNILENDGSRLVIEVH